MKKILFRLLRKFGYSIVKVSKTTGISYDDIQDMEFWGLFEFCKPYTMTGVERMYALYNSVNYILSNNIKGDFVECGVWRGGSSMLIAKMLFDRGITNRKLYLYDTFEGMSEPTIYDISINGDSADRLLKENETAKETSVWCFADLTDVKQNLELTRFPSSNIIFVKGKVEDTLPTTTPDNQIALLRLDTGWYDSTKYELIYLYPKLEIGCYYYR
ncbi:MAG: TylF/MycF/NovP-related O-methyltransferase [Cytophagales bacterium]|nr:TylF/MycF/NovP-related O-methyltransferase [Cytophagales bacterium]